MDEYQGKRKFPFLIVLKTLQEMEHFLMLQYKPHYDQKLHYSEYFQNHLKFKFSLLLSFLSSNSSLLDKQVYGVKG